MLAIEKAKPMFVNTIPVDVVADAYAIAEQYLKRAGQIARDVHIHQTLLDAIIEEYRAGTHHKIKLANRAIARFERSRDAVGAGRESAA